jgi:hypothetical protein
MSVAVFSQVASNVCTQQSSRIRRVFRGLNRYQTWGGHIAVVENQACWLNPASGKRFAEILAPELFIFALRRFSLPSPVLQIHSVRIQLAQTLV